jgi:YggT family protein
VIAFLHFMIDAVLGLISMSVVVHGLLGLLASLEVINRNNAFLNDLRRMLEAVTAPFLRPIRRVVPPLGGYDVSPILLVLTIAGVRMFLLPAIFR